MAHSAIHLPFASGINESSDPRHVPINGALQLRNGRFRKAGAIYKRPGVELVDDTIDGVTGNDTFARLHALRDSLVLTNETSLADWSETRSTFVTRGVLPEATVETSTVMANSTAKPRTGHGLTYTSGEGMLGVDCAQGGGYTAYTYSKRNPTTGTGESWIHVLDTVTGTEVFSSSFNTGASTDAIPRVLYFSNSFFVIYYDSGAGSVKLRYYTPSTNTWTSPSVVGAATASIDLDACVANDRIVIVIYHAGGVSSYIKAFTVNSGGGLIGSAEVGNELTDPPYGFGICYASNITRCAVSYCTFSGGIYYTRVAIFNPNTLVTTLAATDIHVYGVGKTIQSGVVHLSGNEFAVVDTTQDSSAPKTRLVSASIVDTAGTIAVDAVNRVTYWCSLASKPFVVAGKVYAWVSAGGAFDETSATWGGASGVPVGQFTHALLDLRIDSAARSVSATPGRLVASVHPRVARAHYTYLPSLSGTAEPVSNVVVSGNSALVPLFGLLTGDGTYALDNVALNFVDSSRYRSAQLGGELYFAAGAPVYYDGSRVCDAGFLYNPQGPHIAPTAANTVGGAMVAGEQYNYSFCYAYTDARGNVVRSAPSAPVLTSVLAGPNNSFAVRVPTLGIVTQQQADSYRPEVWIEFYRSENVSGSPTTGAQTLRFLARMPNDPTINYVQYTDTGASSAVQNQTILYTTGGRVDNVAPPSLRYVCTHKNRVFGIAPDKQTVWFTSQQVSGEFPAFHDEFTIPFDNDSNLIALASMDDKLIIFGENKIWYLPGDGPLDTLIQNDYPLPIPIAAAFGCNNASSVVACQVGVFFESPEGLFLLDRGLQIVPAGLAVQDTIQADDITSACVVPAESCVYFETDGASRVIYDYRSNQWSLDDYVDTVHDPVDGGTVFNGAYHFTDGFRVLRETRDLFTYGGEFQGITLKTGYLANGINGEQHVKNMSLLVEPVTSANLRVSTFEDYEDASSQFKEFTHTTIAAMRGTSVKVVQLEQIVQRMASKAFLFEELAPVVDAGTGEGLRFLGLTVEVESLQYTTRLPAANKK